MNLNRKERGTVLITLGVSGNSNISSVRKMISKEYSTSSNIKDKGTRKNVLQALKKLLSGISNISTNVKGFIAFAAYDGL